MANALTALSALAAKHYGLVTHSQAMAVGVTRSQLARLVKSKTWERVRPRVFRKAAKTQTEEQELVAICLWLGEGTLVSHRSAARLLGLNVERGLPEVTTSRLSARKAAGLICHRSDDDLKDDRKLQSKIPVTNGARTLIDLASRLDEEQLAIVVEEAWRLKVPGETKN